MAAILDAILDYCVVAQIWQQQQADPNTRDTYGYFDI